MLDHVILRQEFEEVRNQYDEFSRRFVGQLEDKLGLKKISYLRVVFRVKTWDSFIDKVKRKNYSDPINQIEDICGFRIIIRDASLIEKIVAILEKELNIINSENKKASLSPDRFNYNSYHLIATIKQSWAVVPEYREVQNLKFEIQIRSELMDTWANISHDIFYKKGLLSEEDQRRLYRLSALMESGDIEISYLLSIQQKNKESEARSAHLQQILDQYFPERQRNPGIPILDLLKEMDNYGLSTETLVLYLRRKREKLYEIENEAYSDLREEGVAFELWQTGFVHMIMYLTIEPYWLNKGKKYSKHYISVIEKNQPTFKLENNDDN